MVTSEKAVLARMVGEQLREHPALQRRLDGLLTTAPAPKDGALLYMPRNSRDPQGEHSTGALVFYDARPRLGSRG